MPDAQTQVGQRSPARRTIVKGAAWAVPAVTLATAAPAMANSPIPPNGLNGWVTLSRDCDGHYEFTIDGRGEFTGGGDNDRGIWTFVPDPNASITFAEIIFYFNRGGGASTFSFTNEQTGTGWSGLTRYTNGDSSAPSGYYAYRATYNGNWTYYPQYQAWVANSDPRWRENNMPGSCGEVCAYARRTITVNDETVSFVRGPVCV